MNYPSNFKNLGWVYSRGDQFLATCVLQGLLVDSTWIDFRDLMKANKGEMQGLQKNPAFFSPSAGFVCSQRSIEIRLKCIGKKYT